MQNIILVGMPGVGKSGVGRALAASLGLPMVDLDAAVAEHAGRSVPEIFAAEGEAAFRRLESAVLAAVLAADGQVIATGGGAVLAAENRKLMRARGVVIWLQAEPEELMLRMQQQKGGAVRPLLAVADPQQRLKELAEQRHPLYAAVSHHVLVTDGLSREAVVDRIQQLLKVHPQCKEP